MPRAAISFPCSIIVAGVLFLGACAQMRVDYQTPHFMASRDIVRERVSTWVGPWMTFTVSDLRDAAGFRETTRDGATVYPQESVYDEETDFAHPLAESLELILADRKGPADFAPRSADICIRRYDFVVRHLDEDVIQYEVRAQFGFRAIKTEPCQGEHDFTHASWSVGIFDGASEERTKSEGLTVFVDQILREYLKRSRAAQPQLQPIVLAVAPATAAWTPPREKHSWYALHEHVRKGFELQTYFDPSQIQNYQSVHSAMGQMLGQLLVPEVNIAAMKMGAPAEQPDMPTLVVEPIYVGVLLESVALLHVRVSFRWPNGAVLFDHELDGACIATPVQPCTLQRQLETIARELRKEVPLMLAYTVRQPPAPPATPAEQPQAPAVPEPASESGE